MSRLLLVFVAGLALVVVGCGQSKEEKAKQSVCDARADIQKQVKELQKVSLGTTTTDQVKSHLQAIGEDLKKISDQRDQLDDTRKQQVEKANEAFKSQLGALRKELASSKSPQAAAQQLKTAFADLATAYKRSFGPIDCG